MLKFRILDNEIHLYKAKARYSVGGIRIYEYMYVSIEDYMQGMDLFYVSTFNRKQEFENSTLDILLNSKEK